MNNYAREDVTILYDVAVITCKILEDRRERERERERERAAMGASS
jgi:hypothetical protein